MEKRRKIKVDKKELEQLGFTFLRFDDLDIKFKMEKVIVDIKKWIEENQ